MVANTLFCHKKRVLGVFLSDLPHPHHDVDQLLYSVSQFRPCPSLLAFLFENS